MKNEKPTLEEAIDIAFKKLSEMPEEEFLVEIEKCKNDPFTKILEAALGCDRCLKQNDGVCKSCVLGD